LVGWVAVNLPEPSPTSGFQHHKPLKAFMTKIQNINALEILDSRGNPTVMVNAALNNGITATACVPSGL
jgi:hypothetical protein